MVASRPTMLFGREHVVQMIGHFVETEKITKDLVSMPDLCPIWLLKKKILSTQLLKRLSWLNKSSLVNWQQRMLSLSPRNRWFPSRNRNTRLRFEIK